MDVLVLVAVLLTFQNFALASVISKSSKQECITESDVKNLNNTACTSKLVVSLTINANEGKSQFIEAMVSRIIDATKKKLKTQELKNPLRIKVTKSPVIINYPLYQVGYVSNWPREEIKNTLHGKLFRCRDHWYANDNEVNCGFARSGREKIFDSQGFCCSCHRYSRGGRGQFCSGFTNKLTSSQFNREVERHKGNAYIGHCLKHDGLKYFVMALYPPQLQFEVNVLLERRSYITENNSSVWETVSELKIGPQKRIATSDTHQVKAEYVADFHASSFVKSAKLAHRFLLIPDMKTMPRHPPFPDIKTSQWNVFHTSIKNISEWMAIEKQHFDLSGYTCNKIGVSYTAFRRQPSPCAKNFNSCLFNQPYLLWVEEKRSQREKREGNHMLYNFGKVFSLPHTNERTDFQINFIADRPTTSLVVLTIAADDIRVITRVAPGRIVSAYIDSFEALSTTGTLLVIIQNTGAYTTTYNVYVQHCSAGVDLVPSKTVSVDPNQSKKVTFVMHSFHSVGKINHCQLDLYDINSKLLDNMTITFETLDTCFCYGFCGCACGNNKTVCPDAPERPDSELRVSQLRWYDRAREAFKKFGEFFKNHGGKFLIMFWVVFVLCCLGGLKVLHMVITQEVKMDAMLAPPKEIMRIAKEWADWFFKELCPTFCDNMWTTCGRCCIRCCRGCCWAATCGKVSRHENLLYARKVERGWRVPPHCDGMCDGAKYRRRLHRKMMRAMKRIGQKKEAPWFSKPYNCTCKVKDQMPCVMICKGLFFFFYCPLLPVYWILEFVFILIRRRYRKAKRLKAFRAERAEREAKKQKQYVHMDQYRKGVLEKEIVSLDKELKEIRQMEKDYEAELKGINPGLEEMHLEQESDQVEAFSDTSDPDQADDIGELLTPGFPVYFNYAIANKKHPLMKPPKSYSIKGRLIRESKNRFIFDTYEYNFQVSQELNGKIKALKPPLEFNGEAFRLAFKESTRVLKLVSLTPLFTCLNDTKQRKK